MVANCLLVAVLLSLNGLAEEITHPLGDLFQWFSSLTMGALAVSIVCASSGVFQQSSLQAQLGESFVMLDCSSCLCFLNRNLLCKEVLTDQRPPAANRLVVC